MWTVYGIQTEGYISWDQDEEAVVGDVILCCWMYSFQ
jgi:hypothetical protein